MIRVELGWKGGGGLGHAHPGKFLGLIALEALLSQHYGVDLSG